MNSNKKAQELFEKHGFEIANSIVDAMLDENLPEFNQSKIDFWLDVKNDLKRISLAIASYLTHNSLIHASFKLNNN